MKGFPEQNEKKPEEGESPYGDLYVYFLNGVLERDGDAGFGDTYLGNWVEEGNSFLFFSKPSRDFVNRSIQTFPGLAVIDEYHFSYEDWQGGDAGPQRIAAVSHPSSLVERTG